MVQFTELSMLSNGDGWGGAKNVASGKNLNINNRRCVFLLFAHAGQVLQVLLWGSFSRHSFIPGFLAEATGMLKLGPLGSDVRAGLCVNWCIQVSTKWKKQRNNHMNPSYSIASDGLKLWTSSEQSIAIAYLIIRFQLHTKTTASKHDTLDGAIQKKNDESTTVPHPHGVYLQIMFKYVQIDVTSFWG